MKEYIIYGIIAAAGIIMLRVYAMRKHALRTAAAGMITGAAGLLLLHYFGGYIGFAPPLNMFNTAVSLVLGLPGVALIAGTNLLL